MCADVLVNYRILESKKTRLKVYMKTKVITKLKTL